MTGKNAIRRQPVAFFPVREGPSPAHAACYLSPAPTGAGAAAGSPASLAVCPGLRVDGFTFAASSAFPAIRRSPVIVVAPQTNSSS